MLPGGSISVNNYKITNLAAPTINTDLATKQYADEVAQISTGISNTIIVTSELIAN